MFWNAARVTAEPEFDDIMIKMSKLNMHAYHAYQYLNGIGTRYWSKHSFSTQVKCDLLLNNMTECFNAYIMQAKDKPTIQMREIIRKLVMSRLSKKYELYSSMKGELGPRVQKKLDTSKTNSRNCVASWVGDMMFEVERGSSQNKVDLNEKTCTCRSWNLTGIPCVHAIQSIYYIKKKKNSRSLYMSLTIRRH